LIFWLGTHQPQWLGRTSVPLFVSHRTLSKLKTLPRALGWWALDSGGFSELSLFGEWRTTPSNYVAEVRRYEDQVGKLVWAAPQDWMCEPFILAKTGLSVPEHQRRTIASLLDLRMRAPEIRWIPVLQGYAPIEFGRCAEMYLRAGIDLLKEPLVGVGSVCRRQNTSEAERVMRVFAGAGLKLHGFGFSTRGLARCGKVLRSSDSMAWSMTARRSARAFEGHTHKNCANCMEYALKWRKGVLTLL
jgi:hypothetical protein